MRFDVAEFTKYTSFANNDIIGIKRISTGEEWDWVSGDGFSARSKIKIAEL